MTDKPITDRPIDDRPVGETAPHGALPSDAEVEASILAMARAGEDGKSIDPSDVAKAFGPGENWQRVLPVVRRVAVRLAKEGRLLIYRKGKPVDPEAFRGVYRLGLPRED